MTTINRLICRLIGHPAVRSLARTPDEVIRDMRERQRPLLDVPRRRRAGR